MTGIQFPILYIYIVLVGSIYPGLNLIAKIAKVIEFFYGATERMKLTNTTKMTKIH